MDPLIFYLIIIDKNYSLFIPIMVISKTRMRFAHSQHFSSFSNQEKLYIEKTIN